MAVYLVRSGAGLVIFCTQTLMVMQIHHYTWKRVSVDAGQLVFAVRADRFTQRVQFVATGDRYLIEGYCN